MNYDYENLSRLEVRRIRHSNCLSCKFVKIYPPNVDICHLWDFVREGKAEDSDCPNDKFNKELKIRNIDL